MYYLLLKTGITVLIIVVISEIGKRSPTFAALVASLPLISVLGMVWLWRDTKDVEGLAEHSQSTFWYVIPSLPMFLLIPYLLRHGVGFYMSLAIGIGVTIALYLVTGFIASRFGVRF